MTIYGNIIMECTTNKMIYVCLNKGNSTIFLWQFLGVGKMMIDIDRPWVNTSSYGMNINLHQFANCFGIAIWLFNIAMENHHV